MTGMGAIVQVGGREVGGGAVRRPERLRHSTVTQGRGLGKVIIREWRCPGLFSTRKREPKKTNHRKTSINKEAQETDRRDHDRGRNEAKKLRHEYHWYWHVPGSRLRTAGEESGSVKWGRIDRTKKISPTGVDRDVR